MACATLRLGDDPASAGLKTATVPGGWNLHTRVVGTGPDVYETLTDVFRQMQRLADIDRQRPFVELYLPCYTVELFLPVVPPSGS